MPDKVSRVRARLHDAREIRQERAADFWQRTIDAGRIQRQTNARQQSQSEKQQEPRQAER